MILIQLIIVVPDTRLRIISMTIMNTMITVFKYSILNYVVLLTYHINYIIVYDSIVYVSIV